MRIRSAVAAVTTLGLGLGVMSYAAARPPATRRLRRGPARTAPIAGSTDRRRPEVAEQALADASCSSTSDPATQPAGRPRRDPGAARPGRSTATSSAAPTAQAADQLLARPAAQKKKCSKHTCVHWTQPAEHRVAQTDTSPANGIPDYVDKVLATMEHVHRTYVRAGYRAPLSPTAARAATRSATSTCATSATRASTATAPPTRSRARTADDVSAYCVLDNDYTPAEFPTNTPIENMRVTAAHEYFHAVQFAYDFLEDGWFMEATATWAEDELYDSVNDNVQLPAARARSARAPARPSTAFLGLERLRQLDRSSATSPSGCRQSKAGMPVLVRDMWRRADAQARQARPVLPAGDQDASWPSKHRNFAKTYASFAEANRRTARDVRRGRKPRTTRSRRLWTDAHPRAGRTGRAESARRSSTT